MFNTLIGPIELIKM